MNNSTRTILVASADAAVQNLAAKVLTAAQTRLVAVASVKALLEYLLQNDASLVLFDPGLAPLSGFDAFAIVKSHHPNVPAIFLFEDEQYETAQTVAAKGAIYRMPKPIDENALAQIAATVLKTKPVHDPHAENSPE
jgi:DNA-binding NtrC family response regulator